jgi:DNA-binding transcriptional MerR regulator
MMDIPKELGAIDQLADELTMLPKASEAAEAAGSTEHVEPLEQAEIDLAQIASIIPDKMAFKIGEVADLAGLKTYVLRYWESEFDALNPQKSAFNQRMYSRRDVETVLLIKKLLYDEKFSIAGAKRKIKELRKELKVEKVRIEVNTKVDKATQGLEELVQDISRLKLLFI